MELDPESIDGSWAIIGDEEYFVYTRAKMLGFCIIGSHEPCFSVSSFFSKNDAEYKSQYEKFSSLLFDLKARVEEAEKNNKGGEQLMDNLENQEQEVLENETPVVDEPQDEVPTEEEQEVNFDKKETENAENSEEINVEQKEEEEVETTYTLTFDSNSIQLPEISAVTIHENPLQTEFDKLQQQYEDLQKSFEKLNQDLNSTQDSIKELTSVNESLNNSLEQIKVENEQLKSALTVYEEQKAAAEEARKSALVEKYEKIISETEEINVIKG